MQNLVEGIHQFENGIFSSKQRSFENLAYGQQPLVLFITCSVLRISPHLLPPTESSELLLIAGLKTRPIH